MRHREFRRRARRINERTPLGLILLIVGGALLARQMGALLPAWLFTWEVLLITIGLTIGIVNRFRDIGWLIITAVGVFFLMDDVYPEIKHYVWPAVIILLGLIIILRPSRQKKIIATPEQPGQSQEHITGDATAKEDVLDAVAVFGAVKKVVLSKNFKGGEVVSVFGGSEINLTQADFVSPVRLEIVAIFGGAKLIVPANWEVRSEATAILGGIDDKRDATAQNPDKVLILEGTAICGGIEINSY
jgi:predicted membrane protein